MTRRQPPRDALDQRIRDLEAEAIAPVLRDWRRIPDAYGSPRARREALAEAIGCTDTYVPGGET